MKQKDIYGSNMSHDQTLGMIRSKVRHSVRGNQRDNDALHTHNQRDNDTLHTQYVKNRYMVVIFP